jgi:hypothetical protein
MAGRMRLDNCRLYGLAAFRAGVMQGKGHLSFFSHYANYGYSTGYITDLLIMPVCRSASGQKSSPRSPHAQVDPGPPTARISGGPGAVK